MDGGKYHWWMASTIISLSIARHVMFSYINILLKHLGFDFERNIDFAPVAYSSSSLIGP
jgi:hypothetical protein